MDQPCAGAARSRTVADAVKPQVNPVQHRKKEGDNADRSHLTKTTSRFITLASRQLFAVIFIIASAGHFSPGTIASAGAQGVPIPGLLVPVSGLIALLGGLKRPVRVSRQARRVAADAVPRAGHAHHA